MSSLLSADVNNYNILKPPQLVYCTPHKGNKTNLSYPLWCAVIRLTSPFYFNLPHDCRAYYVRISGELRIDRRQPVVNGYVIPAQRQS